MSGIRQYNMKNNVDWDDLSDFEKWFLGSGCYVDGDLERDPSGNYTMPLTQDFYECWCAAQNNVLNKETTQCN